MCVPLQSRHILLVVQYVQHGFPEQPKDCPLLAWKWLCRLISEMCHRVTTVYMPQERVHPCTHDRRYNEDNCTQCSDGVHQTYCYSVPSGFSFRYGIHCCYSVTSGFSFRYGIHCCYSVTSGFSFRYGIHCCYSVASGLSFRYGIHCCYSVIRILLQIRHSLLL